jgi:hypothetical protein
VDDKGQKTELEQKKFDLEHCLVENSQTDPKSGRNASYLIYDADFHISAQSTRNSKRFKIQLIFTKNYIVWTSPGFVNFVKIEEIETGI